MSKFQDVYDICPVFEDERFLLRLIQDGDAVDLLRVYSDREAVPFFNSDNCHGDDFYYKTLERMREAISFWKLEYAQRGFVRWCIIDKAEAAAVGTIELFHRDAQDAFTNCGLLRLDLRSDYERKNTVEAILRMILPCVWELFDCSLIVTKAIPKAEERILALKKLGFEASCEKLVGFDGTEYGDYYILRKETDHA